ncbi:MAG: tRNA lysidine(34) synthetase TilS [Planctomycetaceae bacterium]|nr:tRNA lysidine(34) synthetase TilS [Planctomycetaceae bacterium]
MLLEWITTQALLEGVHRLLLAVSGGADSVAMAHALDRLVRGGKLNCQLVIGHVNHSLRGEHSDGDEEFVRDLAGRLDTAFESAKVDVKGCAARERFSIETAARRLRLEALIRQCQLSHCDAIATAHHRDDQAETLVHRLMRGTGFRGLCGIRPAGRIEQVLFVRPMLAVGRGDIEAYCRQNGLTWRQDATNLNLEPTRNRIRHLLLPHLQNQWPNAVDGLTQLSRICCRMQERAETEALVLFKRALAARQEKSLILHRSFLVECPPWVFYEVIRHGLVQLGAGLRDYTQAHFEKLHQMVIKASGRYQFPDHIRIKVTKRTVTFEQFSV